MAKSKPQDIEEKMIDAGKAVALREADAENAVTLTERLHKSEIELEVAHARDHPRMIQRAVQAMTAMATLSKRSAEQMSYALKRGDKLIEGPSIRMAEIIGNTWGNCRIYGGEKNIDRANKKVTVIGVFHDLETNTKWIKEVTRGIRDKYGNIYQPHMIDTVINASVAIAVRNAILAGVPRAAWEDAWLSARKVAAGEAKDLNKARKDTIAAFGKIGVTPDKLLAFLSVKEEINITLDHIATLRGVWNSINTEESTIEEVFGGQTPQIEVKPAKGPAKRATSLDEVAAQFEGDEEKIPEKLSDERLEKIAMEGALAFHKGIENPPGKYGKNTAERDAWLQGFEGARVESEDN